MRTLLATAISFLIAIPCFAIENANIPQALIQRGEYLARVGHCISCHTNIADSSNITPDKETGIGTWSDEDFLHAMRESRAHPYFNKLSGDDLLAIKAYLFSLPAVYQKNRSPDWHFVFRFKKEEYQYNPEKTAVWNRGAYLVQGLGLSDESNLQDFTREDEKAITFYLEKEFAHVSEEKPPLLPPTPAQAMVSVEVGKKVYERACSTCHTEGKLGAPKIGDKNAWVPLIAQRMDVLIQHAIQGYKTMPARGACHTCTDAEIIAATKYMVQESKTNGDYSLW